VEDVDAIVTAEGISEIDGWHEIGARIAEADSLPEVLERVVAIATSAVKCDACFMYVLEAGELVLRASKNAHPEAVDRFKLRVGEGITGWVAEHRQPVAVPENAFQDPRFQREFPEERCEALLSVPLLSRGRLVGVINLQHKKPHNHTPREIRLVSTVGFLAGGEIERARLESEVTNLSNQLQTRKLVERAKGILQRELGLTEETAYLTLQRQSRQRRKPMKEVAQAIILAEDVKRGRDPAAPRI
jgi:uroporphyrinogen-III synthase